MPSTLGATRIGGHSGLRRRLTLVLVGVLLALALAEIVFRFVPRPHGVGSVLSQQVWMRRCWRTDASGYREQPAGPRTGVDTVNIVVVGDSFAAGRGICDPRDRFADQLALGLERAYPGRYRVSVVAEPGLEAREELARLTRFPVVPDAVVLSYFGDDIHAAADEGGLPLVPPRLYEDLGPAARFLVTQSYLLNYFYWMAPRPSLYDEVIRRYRRAWAMPEIVERHAADLEGFVALGVPLAVVIFPYPPEPELSALYADVVGRHLTSRGAAVIKVDDLVRDLTPTQRLVSALEPHASVEVHRRVGRALIAWVAAAEIESRRLRK